MPSLGADDAVTVRNLAYEYDERYQLTLESWAGESYEYGYDKAGNRVWMDKNGTLTDYTYNVRNQIVGWSRPGESCAYEHDDNGNRTLKTVNGVATAYDYDVNDRLIAVDTDYDGLNFVPDFEASYDYRTRRITKTENAETTLFRYDGGVSFREIDGDTGDTKVEFIRGSGMGGGIGSILYSERPADEREYFVYNAVGHTVATVTETTAVKSTNLYEAFGNIVIKSGSSDNNRLANTKERDEAIGLDNHGFRYYDPEIGRYATRDLFGYGDGMNVYVYLTSNPVNHVDPLGLKIEVEGDEERRKLEALREARVAVMKAKTEDERTKLLGEYGGSVEGLDSEIKRAKEDWGKIKAWNEAVHRDIALIKGSGGLGWELVDTLEKHEDTFRISQAVGEERSSFDYKHGGKIVRGGTIRYNREGGKGMKEALKTWGQSNIEVLAHELSHAYDWGSGPATKAHERYWGMRFINYMREYDDEDVHELLNEMRKVQSRRGLMKTERRATAVQNQIAKDLGKTGRRTRYYKVKHWGNVTNPRYSSMEDLQKLLPYNPPGRKGVVLSR